jgi:hypothetical protein
MTPSMKGWAMAQHEPKFAVHPTVTSTAVVTPAERVADTCHRLGYLIDRHHLPEPIEVRVRRLSIAVDLMGLHDLNRWADATDAAVTTVKEPEDYLRVACTVLGDVPLRLTCMGEALTP